jgi:hypothetical protein
MLTKKRLRSRAWRRLYRGIYADSSLPDTHQMRCIAASLYLMPPGSAIAGRSAAVMLGFGLADKDDPVEVLVPRGAEFGPVAGLRVHSGDLADEEVCRVRATRVTGPARTCWDLARWLPLADAVALIDRLLCLGTVTRASLVEYLERREGDRGWRRFQRVLSLVDGRAESPQESRLRARLVLAGLAPPEVQFSVFSEGRFVARVDLAWPDLKIAIEYDGVWHVGSAPQMQRDRQRLNRLVAAGWIVLHVTSARLREDFDGLVAEIRRAIGDRRRSMRVMGSNPA